MFSSRVFLVALVLCLAAPSSSAQGMDDLLAPLSPSEKTSKGGKKKGKVTKKAPAKAPVTKKGKKPAKGATEPAQAPDDSGLLAPLVEQKTEVLVRLQGTVRGARLFIDEKDLGAVAKTPLELTPGEHTVVVRRPGYRDFSKRIVAKEGSVTEVGVQLEAVAGFVSVKADVPGSRVLIDGEEKGTVPLEGLVLSVGSHEIVVQREGFRPETQRIAVRAGREYTVDVSLRPERVASADEPRVPKLVPNPEPLTPSPLAPEPTAVASSRPLTQRWYFWAGVGAVVVAAAAGTYVATQPLDPNEVCGTPCDSVINSPGRGLLRF